MANDPNLLYLCMGEYVGVPRLDVFLGYVAARHHKQTIEHSYRIYVTNQLKGIAEGKAYKSTWIDMIQPKKVFDADKVAQDIIDRAGLVIT